MTSLKLGNTNSPLFNGRKTLGERCWSTSPPNLSKLPVCIAKRMRCSMNHADFCVIPSDRANSCELIPFQIVRRTVRHTARNAPCATVQTEAALQLERA